MNSPNFKRVFDRAWKLAEALDHKHCTVEHLIAAAYSHDKAICQDVTAFLIDHVPIKDGIEEVTSTQGLLRVVRRLKNGANLISAIGDEGDEAWGPTFLSKHGLIPQKHDSARPA